jgi:hypothetical protein
MFQEQQDRLPFASGDLPRQTFLELPGLPVSDLT